MPNHVYSLVRIEGEQSQIDDFIAQSVGEEELEFTRHYPCPPELLKVISPVRIVSQEEYDTYSGNRDKPITQEMCDEYLLKYGVPDWYSWCKLNWSTKWGCYNIRKVKDNIYTYQTAWTTAKNLWLKISELYPALEFVTLFCDEGGGFIGMEIYRSGKSNNCSFSWVSHEANLIRACVGYAEEQMEEDVNNLLAPIINYNYSEQLKNLYEGNK